MTVTKEELARWIQAIHYAEFQIDWSDDYIAPPAARDNLKLVEKEMKEKHDEL